MKTNFKEQTDELTKEGLKDVNGFVSTFIEKVVKKNDSIKISEKQLHSQICQYIKIQYQNIIFNTDLSGIKLSIGQAKQLKFLRSSKGIPDIVIYHPMQIGQTTFYGLFLEVKKESPYKKMKTGYVIKENEHLREQKFIIDRLCELGYIACFVWSFDMAKNLIDNYLKKYNKHV
jgi:hypothetical protein